MNRENSVSGTKITVRRLFKNDINKICECFKDYDKLFFNPVTSEFVNNVFLYGELWGAFAGDRLLAAGYLHPFDCELSHNQERYSLLCDFVDTPSEYLYLGYVGFHSENLEKTITDISTDSLTNELYRCFLNIAEMQAFRQGYRKVLHCVPLKTVADLCPFFACGYRLVKLRGLEKLVVHYIFCKEVYGQIKKKQKGESTAVALCNTKALSAFLENEYYAFDILKDGNKNVVLLNHQ